MEKKSAPLSLNRTDYRKIAGDMAYFFLVPVSFYLLALVMLINEQGHVFKLSDLLPTNTTIIAIITWLCNQLLNAIRKYVS